MADPAPPSRRRKPRRGPRRNPGRGLTRRLIGGFVVIAVLLGLAWPALYAAVPPPVTVLMAQQALAGHGLDYR